MAEKTCSDEEFIRLFRSIGATETSRELGINIRNVFKRRNTLQQRLAININSPSLAGGIYKTAYPMRVHTSCENGVVIVGGDAHYWPQEPKIAHRAMVLLCRELKPKIIVANGDMFDGASIGRHPPIGWNHVPTTKDLLECTYEKMMEFQDAAPSASYFWNLGNHDNRFDNKLSGETPEFNGVIGHKLSDHFTEWKFGVSLWINNDVVVKHRFRGGIHATHNNTVMAGKTMITNHLHSAKVTPFDDYNGTRYGVDSGMLANKDDPQFAYGEDNPTNHRSGGTVLTFFKGKLLYPELFLVIDDTHIQFRGKVIEVP